MGRRTLAALIASALALAAIAEPTRLTVLHTNDLHSHAETYPRIATFLRELRRKKEAAGEAVLTVDAGDFFSGTLYHLLGPGEEPEAPELELFHEARYDAFTLGNHEFDAGEAGLWSMLTKGLAAGWLSGLVATNFEPRGEDGPARSWRQRIPRSLLKEMGGLKVGILGFMGPDAARSSATMRPSSGFAGFDDAGDEERLAELAAVARKEAAALRSRGARVVVAVIHGGNPEDEALAETPGIDLVVAGHTHELVPPYKKGKGGWIAQAGSFGRHVGVLEWELTDGGLRLRNPGATAVAMDERVAPDPAWQKRLERYRRRISARLARSGWKYDAPVTTFHRSLPRGSDFHSPLGRFVTSRLLEEANRRLPKPADVYLTSLALLRDDIRVPAGDSVHFRFDDVFRLLPIGFSHDGNPGSPVTVVHLDRADFKKALELLEVYRRFAPNFTLVGSDSMDYRVRWWGIPLFNRIADLRLHGKPLSEGPPLVAVATNTYVASYLARIPAMSRGLIRIVPRDARGKPLEADPGPLLTTEPLLLAEALRRATAAAPPPP